MYAISAGRNTQSTTFCSLAGDDLVYGCYQIYPEPNAEIISLCCDCNWGKVLILFSQSTQMKFSNPNPWSNFSRVSFLAGVYLACSRRSDSGVRAKKKASERVEQARVYFDRIDGKSAKFAKLRSRENFMPHGKF